MICSNNLKTIQKAIKLKGQGLSKNKKKLYYWHDEIGYNYRMTNICAAIGFAQMASLKNILDKKTKIFDLYKKYLDKRYVRFLETDKNSRSSYWLVCILLKNNSLRNNLMFFLKKNGIETRNTFYLASRMNMYKRKGKFKYANLLSSSGLCLPSYPSLNSAEIKKISNKINFYLKKFKN